MQVMEARRRKAYESMKEAGFQKAVLGDPMSVNYFTGIHVTPYERFYGLVLDAVEEKCVMVNPSVDIGCMKGLVEEIVYSDTDGPEESIKKAVGKCSSLAVETKYYSMAVGYQ